MRVWCISAYVFDVRHAARRGMLQLLAHIILVVNGALVASDASLVRVQVPLPNQRRERIGTAKGLFAVQGLEPTILRDGRGSSADNRDTPHCQPIS